MVKARSNKSMNHQVEQLATNFRKAMTRDVDRGYLPKADIVDWKYLHQTRHHPGFSRGTMRQREQYKRQTLFNGITAFADWIGQQEDLAASGQKTSYGPWNMSPALAKPLISTCHRKHVEFLHTIGLRDPALEADSLEYAIRSAQEFFFSTAFVSSPPRVIDFGAGYGRNAFLFADIPDAVYCAIDSIEKNYCAQTILLKFAYPEGRVYEYLEHPDADIADIEEFIQQGGGSVHIPTWRLDLLPARLFNVLILVWVFYELNETAAWAVLDEIVQKLPEEGTVLLRGQNAQPAHAIDLDKELSVRGFARFLTLNQANYDRSMASNQGITIYTRRAVVPVAAKKSISYKLKHYMAIADRRLTGGLLRKLYRTSRRKNDDGNTPASR